MEAETTGSLKIQAPSIKNQDKTIPWLDDYMEIK